MASNEFGILLQGRVSSWTNDIINEYKKNFPNAEIVFSTWKNENVDGINCKVIQSEKPSPTYPHSSNINLQIIGSREGLKEMSSEVILKCRSDIFIHNKNIFKVPAKFSGDVFVTRAFKPLKIILQLMHSKAENWKKIFIFLGKTGKNELLQASKSWDIEYKQRVSVTSNDSTVIEINRLKKK